MATDLEQRLRELEDRLAIMQLLASYGPAVDSQDAETVGRLFTQDGVYETDPFPLDGRAAIERMVTTDPHKAFVAGGCAHFLSPAKITLQGDRATATFHSLLVGHDEATDQFAILRASANYCSLVRTEGGWQIERRVNRVLNGDVAARALFTDELPPR